MKKVKHWRTSVQNTINREANVPFVWGQTDCSMFTASVLLAMTGTDYGDQLRGLYNSSLSALRIAYKHKGLINLVSECLGTEMKKVRPTDTAKDGDVVFMADKSHDSQWNGAIGIVVNGRALFKAENGVIVHEFHNCNYFWRL